MSFKVVLRIKNIKPVRVVPTPPFNGRICSPDLKTPEWLLAALKASVVGARAQA